jgi:hypothetical protein
MKRLSLFLTLSFLTYSALFSQNGKLESLNPQPRQAYYKSDLNDAFHFTKSTCILLNYEIPNYQAANILNAKLVSLGLDTLPVLLGFGTPEYTSHIFLGINDPNINNYLWRDRISPDAPGKEGYLLDVGSKLVLLNGCDSAGLYYGLMTLSELITKNNNDISILPCRVIDAPEFPIRWVYYPTNMYVGANVDKAKEDWYQWSKLKLNGVMVADVKFNFIDALEHRYQDSLSSLAAFAKSKYLNFIPSVFPFGYSNSILFFNPNFASGLPVQNQKFVINNKTGNLVPTVKVGLSNGGFENHYGNSFPGFLFIDNKYATADEQIYHSGKTSIKFDNFDGGNARICYQTKVSPFKYYHISGWVRTEDLVNASDLRIAVINTKGVSLNYANINIPTTTNSWKKIDLMINSLESDTLNIYWGIWSAKSGKIWWDDISVEEESFVNLLRRDGTPVTVTNLLGSKIYQEGVDYDSLRDPKTGLASPWYGDFDTYHTPPNFTISDNSLIKDGDTVLISYYHAITIYDGQVDATMSDDKLYEQLELEFSILDSIVKPNYYFMSHDELRTMNWDYGDKIQNKKPAELLAANVNRLANIIHKYNPNSDIWDWSDMFDEYHNAIQKNYYFVNGDLRGSADLITNSIGITNWNSQKDKQQQSLQFFSNKGFRQISAPFYDQDANQIRIWKENTRDVPNFKGMMYTTWSKNYNYVDAFAQYSWNHAPYIYHRPPSDTILPNELPLKIKVYGDPYDDNWRLTNLKIYYSTQYVNFDSVSVNEFPSDTITVNMQLHGSTFMYYYIQATDNRGWTSRIPFIKNRDFFIGCFVDGIPSQNDEKTKVIFDQNNNSIKIECEAELQRSINIVDLIGNTFFQGEMHGLQKEISIRNWNRGIYFVTIKSSKQTVVKKVIVF